MAGEAALHAGGSAPEPVQGFLDYARGLGPWFGLGLLALCLSAYGYNLFSLTMAGDTWMQLVAPDFQDTWVIAIGRWMQRLVWELSFNGIFAPSATLLAMLAACAGCHVFLCRAFGLDALEAFCVTGICLFLPFWVEPVNLKINHLLNAVGWGAALAFAWQGYSAGEEGAARNWRLRRSGLAAGAGCVAAAVYQPLLLTGCTVFAALLLLRSLQQQDAPLRGVLRRLALFAAILGAALLSYAVISKLCIMVFDARPPEGQGQYSLSVAAGLSGMLQRVPSTAAMAWNVLTAPQPFFPPSAKFIWLALAGLCCVGVLRHRGGSRALRLGLLALFLGAGFLAPFCFHLLLGKSLRYNILFSMTYCYGLVPAFCFVLYKGAPALRRGVLLACGLLVGIFVLQLNNAGLATEMLNRRDMAETQGIARRIAQQPDYKGGPVRLAVVGRWEYGHNPYTWYDGDYAEERVNFTLAECGVFDCQPGRLESLLPLVSPWLELQGGVRHYETPQALAAQDPAAAALVRQARPWPATGSVFQQGGVYYIWLGRP